MMPRPLPPQGPGYQLIEAETKSHHFADDIFNCILLKENFWISTKTSLKFVHMGLISNNIGSNNGLAPNRRKTFS